MPGPFTTSIGRPLAGTPKRPQEQQQRPAKRAKISQSSDVLQKKSIPSIIPRKSEPQISSSNGFKNDVRLRQVDESAATIANGVRSRNTSMADVAEGNDSDSSIASGDGDASESEEEAASNINGMNLNHAPNGDTVPLQNNDADDSSDGEGVKEQPTFGELFDASAAVDAPIDVAAAFDQTVADPSAATQKKALALPSGATLATVLTQALRTHDRDLLETCLQLNDLDAVRATIERLPSPLALNLLHRLGERLHKRPGRAATLIVWIQWTLVAHGGQLLTQKGLTKKLADLHRVISERAQGLQPLLQLKGKLDMLSAQLELRQHIGGPPEVGADDDDALIYVEDDDDDSSSEMDINGEAVSRRHKKVTRTQVGRRGEHGLMDDDGDDGIQMGTLTDSENEQLDSEEEGMLDDEAEETDRDTGDDVSEAASFEEDDEDDEADFIDDGESIASSEQDTQRLRRSTAAQKPSKKAF